MSSLKGFHIRPHQPFANTIHQAKDLNTNCLQSFVTGTNELLDLEDIDIKTTNKLTQETPLYIHGSYWICPTYNSEKSLKAFKNEYNRALELGARLFVLHLGSAKKYGEKQKGIEQAVRFLNKIVKEYSCSDCKIIVENTAHNKLSIGSDLADFKEIYNLLDQSEKLGFCLDTSHAHAFGYNIQSIEHQNNFVSELNNNVPFTLELIHLNDTLDTCGSFLDRHALIGTGQIGERALQSIVNLLPAVPIIMEAPVDQITKLSC